ncbi:MAG: glyoxalase superfamily protein [Rhodospirillales bacterium]|nr:glyoxalase superfamily protein [Rhodospirillales bacterium]
MTNTTTIPSITSLQAQAKRMRSKLGKGGHPISHSQSLEIIARQSGFKDWNTIFAVAGNNQQECPLVNA